VFRQQAGGCPAATHFSLSRQRKVSKRKATLPSASPFACATGATCGTRSSRGRARTRLRLRQSLALIHLDLRSSAHTEGGGVGIGSGFGYAIGLRRGRALRVLASPHPTSFPHPSGWAEERSRKWIRASDCLSRRRVRARPHFRRAPQVARSEAQGPRPSGRLSFP
jgi:hypothetical protein